MVDEQVYAPTITVARDCGSIGRPALQWLRYKIGLRLVDSNDIFHDLINILLDATAESGLTAIRVNYIRVARLKHGPFKGQAIFSQMRQATKEMRKEWGPDNAVYVLLFEELLIDFPAQLRHSQPGSYEHFEIGWDFVIQLLLNLGCGSETKGMRWWSFEEDSDEPLKL